MSATDYYEFVPIASRILHEWDPIGVYEDRDRPPLGEEYDGYIPGVVGLLIRGADIREIATHLGSLRTANMGLQPNEGADRNTAAVLSQAFKHFRSTNVRQ